MEILLIATIIYLTGGSLVLLRNHFECTALHAGNEAPNHTNPLVSVCIPARNEEDVIRRCVESALSQSHVNLEVLVLDDESTDKTPEILSTLAESDERLKIIKGKPKPSNWLGKPWACAQLSNNAEGEIFIFTDADVWLHPAVVSETVQNLTDTDALTVWPQQILRSFWEQLIIPMVYHALFTLLPAVYVERSPRWIPGFLQTFTDPQFAAANGQYLAFRRATYEAFGGHEVVKDKVVEDVEIASAIKSCGLKFRMLHGADRVFCRMYTDHSEIWNGFRKNFLPGFGHPFIFLMMWIIHIAFFLIPAATLITALIHTDYTLLTLSVICLMIPILQRIYLALKFDWKVLFSLTHILAVLWFQALAIRVSVDRLSGRNVNWKGRSVKTEKVR